MSNKSLLSSLAQQDMDDIFEFTKNKWGEGQAVKYITELEDKFSLLAEFPGMGSEDSKLKCHKFPYQSHVILYQKSQEGIDIIRIIHKHQEKTRLITEVERIKRAVDIVKRGQQKTIASRKLKKDRDLGR